MLSAAARAARVTARLRPCPGCGEVLALTSPDGGALPAGALADCPGCGAELEVDGGENLVRRRS